VVNYTECEVPYTRIIEHKHFEKGTQEKTVIFCGRLADYKYYDMHVVIERALNVVREELGE